MPTRCEHLAKERRLLGPGEPIIIGCELIENSGIFNGVEKWSPRFCDEDGVAGPYGATVIWPETGNDVFSFTPGETVPTGTEILQGQVYDNGEWHDAPYTVTGNDAIAGPESADIDDLANSFGGDGNGDGDGDGNETKGVIPSGTEDDLAGFCAGLPGDVALPTDEEKDWLSEFANFELPELKLFDLSGFTAYITKQLAKVNAALGKVQQKVDEIIDKAKLDPDDICTPPVKRNIRKLLEVIKMLIDVMKVLKKIITVIKIILGIIKIAKRIIMWVFPPLKLVQKFLDMLNIMNLVDMMVSMLIKTVAKFTAILPILQSQLMSILAQCAAADGLPQPTNKEDCEAAGGLWIDPEEINELQELYDQMLSEASSLDQMASGTGGDDGELFGFCSITEHSNQEDCEDAGGTWTGIDADTDFSTLDTTALSDELAAQLDELNQCFSDPDLQDYINQL